MARRRQDIGFKIFFIVVGVFAIGYLGTMITLIALGRLPLWVLFVR
jgi:hypothetical protein